MQMNQLVAIGNMQEAISGTMPDSYREIIGRISEGDSVSSNAHPPVPNFNETKMPDSEFQPEITHLLTPVDRFGVYTTPFGENQFADTELFTNLFGNEILMTSRPETD
jgi:hypothetical protein